MIKLNIISQKSDVFNLRDSALNYKKYPVSIITITNKEEYMHNIIENYLRINYNSKELIIIINSNDIDIEMYKTATSNIPNVSIFKLDIDYYTLGDCLNFGVAYSHYDYIAKMNDNDYYGKNYLIDEVNALNYTDAEIIGKAAYFMYLEQNKSLCIKLENYSNMYVSSIAVGTMLIKKSIFGRHIFKSLNAYEGIDFLFECFNDNIKIYSIDPFNYLYIDHHSMSDHDQRTDDSWLKIATTPFPTIRNYKSIIEI